MLLAEVHKVLVRLLKVKLHFLVLPLEVLLLFDELTHLFFEVLRDRLLLIKELLLPVFVISPPLSKLFSFSIKVLQELRFDVVEFVDFLVLLLSSLEELL